VLALDVPKAITNERKLDKHSENGGINDLKSVKQEDEKM
jgi:hypothetical protein